MTNEACIPNIDRTGRRVRLAFGVITFAVGLALLAWLIFSEASVWWRLALFPVFTGAATGYFQWKDET